jgi:hypothetical protein
MHLVGYLKRKLNDRLLHVSTSGHRRVSQHKKLWENKVQTNFHNALRKISTKCSNYCTLWHLVMALSDCNRLQLDIKQVAEFMYWSTVFTLLPYSKSADLWRTQVIPFSSSIIWPRQQLVLNIVSVVRCVYVCVCVL